MSQAPDRAEKQKQNDAAGAPLEGVEKAKKIAAYQAVDDYFRKDFTYVGIGSGSTILYVIQAIQKALGDQSTGRRCLFVPTGYQSRAVCDQHNLQTVAFDSLSEDQMLDVAFDGADEVDEEFNLIKGGGACLFQEKLVASRAKKFVVVADYRKNVPRLLTTWDYIPVEVAPIAVRSVIKALRALGSPSPTMRRLPEVKSGPLKTDQDFYIVKAPFPALRISQDSTPNASETAKGADGNVGRVWDVLKIASAIKEIPGVLEVGIFAGLNGPQAMAAGGQGGQKPVAVYFGEADGSVQKKLAPE